ncbi:unnamed protein product, partial [Closterium sp. NIES-54]
MASLQVFAFDHEGRLVQFDTWLDDLQLYLLSDSEDSVSLFDLASIADTALPATANSSTRSKWITRHAVVARYSSPATAALGRLLLPYLFPELSAFTTVEDLLSHLRASDARYRAAIPAEFLDRNPPPMYITLYFIVTRLPDSLRSITPPPSLLKSSSSISSQVGLVQLHLSLLGPYTNTPSPLAPSYASTAAADVSVPEDVGAASASAKRRSSKGKGGQGGSGGSGGGGCGSGSGGGGSSGGGGGGGTGGGSGDSGGGGGGSGGSGGGGGGSGGSGGSGGGGTGGSGTSARRVGSGGGQRQQQQRRSKPCLPTSFVSGFCVGTTLTPLPAFVSVRLAEHSGGPVVARSSTVLPCLAVPSGSLSGLHLPSFSTNLVSTAALQDAMVTTTTPEGQYVSICTCTRTGRHLATLIRPPGSSLYTLATKISHVAASAQVSASGQVAASCSCRLLSHRTLLWYHRLGHPSLPRLRGVHSRLLISGLPRSLPPLPPLPAPPCLLCVEGQQRTAPHSSSFPPTTAPLQTLHMDVWGPARVSGQSRERYFLLIVDDYTRYTTVFPLRSKGQ